MTDTIGHKLEYDKLHNSEWFVRRSAQLETDNLRDLQSFVVVARLRNFRRAAAEQRMSASSLSQRMRDLEERLGVRLLNRTTRSVAPTEAGEQLLASLRPAMRDVENALAALENQRDRPAGRLRISTHRMAAIYDIVPYMARFSIECPEVTVELVIQDGLVDIVAEGFDAGVRHQHILEQDMISVRVGGDHRIAIVATPDYLARRGTPVEPQDLLRHNCVNYRYASSGAIYRWQFQKNDETLTLDAPGSLIAGDPDILLEAVRAGVGIGSLFEPQVARLVAAGELIRVLEDWSPFVAPNYLYYAGRRQVSPALRAFIDCMRRPASG
jgi:DNA-binding transcriptional LysR family regulator